MKSSGSDFGISTMFIFGAFFCLVSGIIFLSAYCNGGCDKLFQPKIRVDYEYRDNIYNNYHTIDNHSNVAPHLYVQQHNMDIHNQHMNNHQQHVNMHQEQIYQQNLINQQQIQQQQFINPPPCQNNNINNQNLFNKATKGIYELGSTLKLITAAVAFESDHVKENDVFDVSTPLKISYSPRRYFQRS
jgi:cell division protein FtsI/penicillin-binding protein 2